MASKYDGDDDGNLIEDDKIDEFYARFNNEVDESLAAEEEDIVKSSSPLAIAKSPSLRYYPIFNYRPEKVAARYHPQYRSLAASSVGAGGGGGGGGGDGGGGGGGESGPTGSIFNNRLRSIPIKSKNFITNSGYYKTAGGIIGRNFEYIVPIQRYKNYEAATINDNNNNNIRFKTDTSISGFKNHTSTNYDQQQQQKQKQQSNKFETNYIQNKRLLEDKTHHQKDHQNQFHSHQTRSIIEGVGNFLHQQKTATGAGAGGGGADEVIGSSRSEISFDRVEVSWLEPALPIASVFAVSIFGIVILGIVIIFWLKNLLFHRNKSRLNRDNRINERINRNCQNNRKEGQNFIKKNSEVMDNDSIYKNIDNNQIDCTNNVKEKHNYINDVHQYDCNDDNNDDNDKIIDNKIADELHTNFDSLTIEQTPKNDVLLVDKKSSPIVLDQNGEIDNNRHHFIFTTTPATALTSSTAQQTIDLNSSIFEDSNFRGLTGFIPVAAVPIPVPVPLPIPIPVPIPVTNHHHIYHQQPYRTEKLYKNQGQSPERCVSKNSERSRPQLIKSSSTTSSTSGSSLSTTFPSVTRSRRFSLCDRRSKSPQQTSSNVQNQPKSQSISRLSRRDCYEHDFLQNNQISDVSQSNLNNITQKCFDTHSRTDDKENEIPAGGEVYSPKMKLTEQVLAQQNSPRSFNDSPAATTSSTVTRFTFSPKQILANSENGSTSCNNNNNSNNNNINNSISSPVVQHQTTGPGALCHPSPLLNSAVYKHGNYFKFPEVDCLTPDKILTSSGESPLPPPQLPTSNLRRLNQNSVESHPSSDESAATNSSGLSSETPKIKSNPTTLTTTPPVSQATRRARLKSISLDSDGARLVEDNLGIPVEEIIERTNHSPILDDDCFVFENTINNSAQGEQKFSSDIGRHQLGKEIIKLHENDEPTEDEDNKILYSKDVDTVDGGDKHKFHVKNRNHLTITIGPEVSDGLDNGSGDSVKLIPHLQTPKTPTLTQTKQKAISLDSSDSNIIYCMPSSGNIGANNQENRADLSSRKTSLLQISSISVPTTPKRQQLLLSSSSMSGMGRKLQSTKGNKNRLLSASSKIGLSKSSTSTPSTSFDHDISLQKPQGFITKLRSFNENTLDDGFYDDEQFYLDPDNEMMVVDKRPTNLRSREFSSDLEDEPFLSGQNFAGSSSNLLGANLQNQKCTTSLSLSNNNLKTLPEVMTISDFSTDDNHLLQHPDDEKKPTIIKSLQSPGICNTSGVIQKTPRNSILQRRGSNHSLTLNLNGSLGNLTKSLSVSNYSLGSTNLQTSQCNLSGSSHNLSHHQHQQQQQQHQISGSNMSTATQIGVPQGSVGGPMGNSNICGLGGSKKNLLQRRGSNTSLTLNIKGSSCMSLNRFNSHSSLNISSMQHQNHPHQIQQQHAQPQAHQVGTLGGGGGGPGGGGGGCTKKGLLERRNSNASLTLNIQNRALSISNCNLRGSACSLSSVNTNLMDYDGALIAEHHNEQDDSQQQYDLHYPNSAKHRKFLSSENLNSITQCSKLNQTHVRNSTKTCFGSVSDLKPHQLVQQKVTPQNIEKFENNREIGGIQQPIESKQLITNFGESNLCSCTGVRNITTKPLSPQSTSEDFKMYLANIQLLQNATNVLDDEHLRKLSYIFEKSYSMTTTTHGDCNDSKLEIRATSITATSAIDDQCINDDIIDITINFEAPNDDEQKLLLRNLHQEFWDLPTNYQEKPLVFGSQAKNRYKTILPNEHSRVILDSEPGFAQEPYINANYIKGPDYTQNSYIATQGPMSNTIYDFWLMIYQNVVKFSSSNINSSSSSSNINRTIIEENVEKLETNQQSDIDDDSNNCDEMKITSSNITMILKPKTPTTATATSTSTISSKNEFASGFSNNSDRNSNYKSKGINSGKFNQKIVMLTNFVENNRQKCAIYFPIDAGKIILITNSNDKIDSGDLIDFYENYFNNTEIEENTDTYNNTGIQIREEILIDDSNIRGQIPKSNYFIIKNCGIIKKNGFSIRKLLCIYCSLIDSENYQYFQFLCHHYWFPDWPDHRSPNDIDVLLDMSLHLLDGRCIDEFDNLHIDYQTPSTSDDVDNQPLPIIHCSAGIGRTGCLAAILNGLRQMRSSLIQLNAESGGMSKRNSINVDVLGIVCNLRLQRGGMVQNSEQYELIHRALCLYLKRLDSAKIGISGDEISEDVAKSEI